MQISGFDLMVPPGGSLNVSFLGTLADMMFLHVHKSLSGTVYMKSIKSGIVLV